MSNNLANQNINELIIPANKIPKVTSDVIFKEAIDAMNKFKLGIVCVVNNNNKLKGIFTDGDIRRRIIKIQKPFSALFVDNVLLHTNTNPLVVKQGSKINSCLKLMYSKKVWDLPVVNEKNNLIGLLHLHIILKKIIKN